MKFQQSPLKGRPFAQLARVTSARNPDVRKTVNWILRKFADSGKKHFRWECADVLRKPNSFFGLL